MTIEEISKKRQKVIIVDNSSWNIYNFRQQHIEKLLAAGYEVAVLSPIDEFIGSLKKTYPYRHVALRHLYPRTSNAFLDLFLFFELLRHYKKEKPELVIHFTIKPNIYGSIAAQLLGIPTISVITGLGYPFLHPSGLKRLIPLVYKFAFRRIKRLILYNPDDREELESRKVIPQNKCSIIPGSGINTNHFRPLHSNAEPYPFVFIFMGRLLKDKGLLEFMAAAKQIRAQKKDVEFWVVGSFNFSNPSAISRDHLHEWVENDYIRYFGYANDVRAYLKKANILVLPSYRGEGIPKVILEAMSMGKPIITTDTAGCKETVRHGQNGLLVPSGNTQALIDAMLYMVGISQKERAIMGQCSRRRALEQFDEKIITQQFLQIVNEVISPGSNEPAKRKSSAVFR